MRRSIVATGSSAYRAWIIIGLGSAMIFAVACLAYFGSQTLAYLKMRRVTSPAWWLETPRPLTDTTALMVPGTTLSYFGCRLQVPWVGIEKEVNGEQWVRVFFKTGQDILFANPNFSQNDPLAGDGHVGSKYEHLKAILSVTPSRLSPFRSHRNFARDQLYWERKGLLLEHSGATEIFSFETGAYRGFEVSGIPYNGQASIILFDAADQLLTIRVSGRRDPSGRLQLTQAEVNRIIQTLEPWAEHAPTDSAK